MSDSRTRSSFATRPSLLSNKFEISSASFKNLFGLFGYKLRGEVSSPYTPPYFLSDVLSVVRADHNIEYISLVNTMILIILNLPKSAFSLHYFPLDAPTPPRFAPGHAPNRACQSLPRAPGPLEVQKRVALQIP